MLTLAVLFQVAAALPPELATVRTALEDADTAAAVAILRRQTEGDLVTSASLTSLFLLDWISRSPTWADQRPFLQQTHGRLVARWQEYFARGTMLPDGAGARGKLLRGLMALRPALPWVTPTGEPLQWLFPGDDSTAALGPDQARAADIGVGVARLVGELPDDPWFAGAVQWTLLLRELELFDAFVADVPRVQNVTCGTRGTAGGLSVLTGGVPVTAGWPTQGGCMRPETPPSAFRLAARILTDTGTTARRGVPAGPTALFRVQTLAARFRLLATTPWPFHLFGARAHALLCAVIGPGLDDSACWPATDGFAPGDAAEINALRYAFTGRHALAGKAMQTRPERFGPLDGLRDILDPPDSVVTYGNTTLMGRSVRERRVKGPSEVPDRRLPPEQFWRAAWPLYLQPYNERLVVHRGRLLLAGIAARLAPAERPGLFAPYADPELLVRAGVPLAIVREEGRREMGTFFGADRDPGLRVPAVAYVPAGIHETVVVQNGAAAVPLDLALVARGSSGLRAGHGFASEDYDVFQPLDHQVVQYVRDGQRRVDVYTRWAPPPGCNNARPQLGFFLLDERLEELSRAREADLEARPRKVFRFSARPGMYVYSLELLDRGCRVAERARYVLRVPPAEDAFLSELMLADELYYGDGHRAADRLLDRAPVTVSPSLMVFAGSTARFYWEAYGVSADAMAAGRLTVHLEVLNVRQERVSVLELAEVAAQARRTTGTLDLTYPVAVPPGDAPLTMGLAVGIPAGTRGVHVARITVTDTATGRTATMQRAFFVSG